MSDKPSDRPGDRATRAHKDVGAAHDEHKRREFMHAMLADLRALDRMLREGQFETGPRRIGAEQEMFLIDRHWTPARASLQMLERLADRERVRRGARLRRVVAGLLARLVPWLVGHGFTHSPRYLGSISRQV